MVLELIDSHCHIYDSQFQGDIDAVIEKAKANHVSAVLLPNVESNSIEAMLELEQKFSGFCFPMMGLHPCSVKESVEEELVIIEEWLRKRHFYGIGEIGLDYFWDLSFQKQQLMAFEKQLSWALEFGLPVSLHTRNATAEAIEMVSSFAQKGVRGVFHCFSGTVEEAKKAVEMGFLLGIGGVATFKNGGLGDVIETIGLEHLVLETDSPYLAPVPHRGKRNEPAYLFQIAQKVGEFTHKSFKETAIATSNNARQLFSLPQNIPT